jgi:hypothetical protein
MARNITAAINNIAAAMMKTKKAGTISNNNPGARMIMTITSKQLIAPELERCLDKLPYNFKVHLQFPSHC